jgi:hypothetical protein
VRLLRPLLVAAIAAAGLLPARAADAEDLPAAPVRYPPSSVRPKLIVGGLLIGGIGYGAALLGAEAAPTWPGARDTLRVPLIGPWWTLAINGCPTYRVYDTKTDKVGVYREKCEAFEYLRAGLLILDGLVQAAGVAIVVEAIAMKTEAATAPQRSASSFQLGGVTVHPTPLVSPTFAGLGIVGTF